MTASASSAPRRSGEEGKIRMLRRTTSSSVRRVAPLLAVAVAAFGGGRHCHASAFSPASPSVPGVRLRSRPPPHKSLGTAAPPISIPPPTAAAAAATSRLVPGSAAVAHVSSSGVRLLREATVVPPTSRAELSMSGVASASGCSFLRAGVAPTLASNQPAASNDPERKLAVKEPCICSSISLSSLALIWVNLAWRRLPWVAIFPRRDLREANSSLREQRSVASDEMEVSSAAWEEGSAAPSVSLTYAPPS
mmetsp:Transcript_12156/g.35580  ORF Transcript_12156/g.35580 Transcript_12156/m.35580 type:complete len:250 (-) Transcript_12156:4929-5678(-)